MLTNRQGLSEIRIAAELECLTKISKCSFFEIVEAAQYFENLLCPSSIINSRHQHVMLQLFVENRIPHHNVVVGLWIVESLSNRVVERLGVTRYTLRSPNQVHARLTGLCKLQSKIISFAFVTGADLSILNFWVLKELSDWSRRDVETT